MMLNRSNIEEANKHLQALYGRVSELEHVVTEQHDALLAKDSFIQTKVKELSQQDSIIKFLKQQLADKDQELQDANQKISELELSLKSASRDLGISQRKNVTLGNVVNVIPELKSLVIRMEDTAKTVDEDDPQFNTNDCNSTTNSSSDGDVNNRAVQTKVPVSSPVSQGSVSEMAKEFNMQSGRMKKFSISEDEEVAHHTSSNITRLKEFYF